MVVVVVVAVTVRLGSGSRRDWRDVVAVGDGGEDGIETEERAAQMRFRTGVLVDKLDGERALA